MGGLPSKDPTTLKRTFENSNKASDVCLTILLSDLTLYLSIALHFLTMYWTVSLILF